MADHSDKTSRDRTFNPLNYAASEAIAGMLAGETDLTDDAASATSGESPPFPNVDGYTILRLLGQGAGGVTWLAQRDHTEARVAIKILRERAGDERSQVRAWRELEILQQMRLPEVPRLLDFGSCGPSLFFATEFIDGTALSDLFSNTLPETKDELFQRVQLLERIVRAVAAVHERGVIHRDLKPSNIIVSNRSTPFIIDFGISTSGDGNPGTTLTIEGLPMGTPAFMAPEQARGERASISTRSDVYSLGAIGYWLTTGQTPHDLTDATVHSAVHRVGWEQPRHPRVIHPDLPAKLASVLAKACSADPADRYASAEALADDLAAWLDGRPVSATPMSTWQRAAQWVALHPVQTTTTICMLLAVGILGSVLLVRRHLEHTPGAITGAIPGSSEVTLYSIAGQPLRHWPIQPETIPVFGKLTTIPDALGRGQAAVLAMSFEDGPKSINELRVYHTDALDSPWWTAPSEPPGIAMPPGTENWHLDHPKDLFQVQAVSLAEVFAESPGKEIVAVHLHSPKSASCIRIYGLDGTILWEAWHNGHVSDVAWLAKPRLLVAVGVTDTPSLASLGYEKGESIYPNVLMALRIPGSPISSGSAPLLLDSWHRSPPEVIAWVRTIAPDDLWPWHQIRSIGLRGRSITADLWDLRLTHSRSPAERTSLHILVDDTGSLVSAIPPASTRERYEHLGLASGFDLITPQQAEELAARHRASQPASFPFRDRSDP